ncbi:MAG TPA: bifunctional nuclease domain-containing protein [Actinomycetota bacterium]
MIDDEDRDDATLVAAVVAGDREAFGPLLLRWRPSVLRLCRRLLGPGQEAEDAAQEAAVQAFVGLPRLADPGRFGPWLHAIAANRARMALRGRRLLPLDQLPPDAAVLLRWGEAAPTPEAALADREVHEAIMAALRALPPATRDAVIGFYLQGYSYDELAELLGAPRSAVRGRLYHGRRRLRRALRPLADSVLTADRPRREERTMDPDALVDAEVAFVGRMMFSSERMVMLQEQGGPRRLPLEEVDAATGEAVERLIGREQPLAPATHDLLPRLVEALGGRVEQVAVRRLEGGALYGEITLERDGRRAELQARPGDAVALALAAGAPVRVAAAAMDAAGFDPGDREQRRARDRLDLERLRRRLAERAAPPPPSPIAPPAPLDAEVRRRVEDRLERLRAELDGFVALLTHDSGALVAWAGRGDQQVLERYCQARADGDADLTQLLMREVFPTDQVEAVMFRTVGRLSRVEVAITGEHGDEQGKRFAERTDHAVRELEALLPAGGG